MFSKDHHNATGRIHLKKSEGEIFEIFRIEMDDLSESQEVVNPAEVVVHKQETIPSASIPEKPNGDCTSCDNKQRAPSKAAGCSFKDRPKTKY